MATAATTTPDTFTNGAQELSYIRSVAVQLGLDPEAVLAVAAHEGVTLPAEAGDSDTSFGPWQLHGGSTTSDPTTEGKLPQSIWAQGPVSAAAWANSPAGIQYALQGIASVAQGLKGSAAVSAIVSDFEQPLAPAPEIAASDVTYASGGVPRLTTTIGAPTPSTGGSGGLFTSPTQTPTGQGVTSAIESIPGVSSLGSIEKGIEFLFSVRFLEIIGGSLLVLAGLMILARSFGASVGPASLIPKGGGGAAAAAE